MRGSKVKEIDCKLSTKKKCTTKGIHALVLHLGCSPVISFLQCKRITHTHTHAICDGDELHTSMVMVRNVMFVMVMPQ